MTRRGVETAVLAPIADWRWLQHAAHPGLKELLLWALTLANRSEELNERRHRILSKLRRSKRSERLAGCTQALSVAAVCFRRMGSPDGRKARSSSLGSKIAATARIHGLIVATRNDADFASLDVSVVNPFRGDGCWARDWQRLVPRVIDQRHGGK